MAPREVVQVNGWLLYAHPLFAERLDALTQEVEELAQKDPANFHHHAAAKLLFKVQKCIFERVPGDPNADVYQLGNTLGKTNRNWRRVKHDLPPRYRLFYQFRSAIPQTIIYAWLNDDATLRKAGAKTDAYAVFLRMLQSGKMPSSFAELEMQKILLPDSA